MGREHAAAHAGDGYGAPGGTSSSTEQASGVARVTLATALLFSAANLGANLVFAFFNFAMPQYLDSYHVRPEWIGFLANERSFVGGFIQPLIGRWSDRTQTPLGRRRLFFLVGVPLMALSLVVLGLRPPFALMIVLVSVAGVFLFIAYAPYLAMMIDITPTSQRGQMGAYLGAAAMLGAIAVNVIAGFLWSKHELAVFLFTAVGLLLTYGITFFTVPEPERRVEAPPIPRHPLRYARDVLRYSEVVRYGVGSALLYLGAGGATPFVTLFATKALGVPSAQAFFLVIVLVVFTALGTVPAGLLGDRIGRQRVLVGGLALFAVGALWGAQATSVAGAIPAMILVGLGNACPTALSIPLLSELVPSRRMGEFVGLGSLVFSVAQPIGSLCAGTFVDSALPSTYRHAFIWAGVLIAASALVLLTVSPERARAALDAEERDM